MPWRSDAVLALTLAVPTVAGGRVSTYIAQGKHPGVIVVGNRRPMLFRADEVAWVQTSRLGRNWCVIVRDDGLRYWAHVSAERVNAELEEATRRANRA